MVVPILNSFRVRPHSSPESQKRTAEDSNYPERRMLPVPNLWTNVRRELDCTPTLARINTDYDPGSVVSTAQSNNLLWCAYRPISRHPNRGIAPYKDVRLGGNCVTCVKRPPWITPTVVIGTILTRFSLKCMSCAYIIFASVFSLDLDF